jgi:ABC-type sugar transport system ATPase subunit
MEDYNRFIFRTNEVFKNFGGVQALRGVNFKLEKNDIHALVGENGAGKSTFAKIMVGVYPVSSGEMFLENKPFSPNNRRNAANQGIFIIYQEPSLVSSLNVAENMFLGRLDQFKNKNNFINWNKLYQETEKWLKNMRINISPKANISDLSLGQMKLIEMAKAVSLELKIFIIDEATAILNSEEMRILFNQIETLYKEGKTIIYISHRLDEVFEICKKVTVFKDGKVVDTLNTKAVNKEELSQLMVGRKINLNYLKDKSLQEKNNKKIILKVNNLELKDKYKDINFELHQGEILGVGGLVGSGKEELAESLFGKYTPTAGEIYIKDEKYNSYSIEKAISLSIAYIPKERDQEGLILIFSIKNNITLPILKKISRRNILMIRREKDISKEYFSKLSIKAKSEDTVCNTLSGGNRQKVVLAKWLASKPEILIMNNPTRGIDVGVKSEIYKLIQELSSSGVSILLFSDELPELIGMSDRLIIMRDKVISAIFDNSESEITEQNVIRYMI